MKIQILDRIEPVSSWHEVYANGELLFEGEIVAVSLQFQALLQWLDKQDNIEVEIRAFTVDYKHGEGEEYMPPLRAMTGELYWSDWEQAEGN